jgi:uncharacterized membrane protein YfcA
MNAFEGPDFIHAAWGAAGSAISMLWLKESSWRRRVVLFFGGVVCAVIATPDAAQRVHLSSGLLALMLGVSSMAILAKVFETIQDFNLGKFARDVAYKWAGLPPASTRPTPLPKE